MSKKVLFVALALVVSISPVVTAQETALFFAIRQLDCMEPLAYGFGEKDGLPFKWAIGKSLFQENNSIFAVNMILEDQFWGKHNVTGSIDPKKNISGINFRNKHPMEIIAFAVDELKWKIETVQWAAWLK